MAGIKVKLLLFLLLFSFTIHSQNTSSPDTNKRDNEKNVIDNELQHLQSETDLKIKNLEDKIERDYRELKNENDLREESLSNRMTLYITFILALLGLIGFLTNFFGKQAIKERVENIIQNTIDKYAKTRIDEELDKRITDEAVNDLIEEKGKEAIDKLIKELDTEGKKILEDQNERYDTLINELKIKKDKLEKETTKEEKIKLKEFKDVLSKVKKEEEYSATDWYLKGSEANEEKNYDNAIEFHSKAIQLEPNIAAPYNARGIIYYKLKKYDKALEDFEKALEMDEDKISVYLNIAELLIVKGKIKSSANVLAKTKLSHENVYYSTMSSFFQFIIAVITRNDSSAIENNIKKLLQQNPKIYWIFDEVEEWLSDCSLSETDKAKIQEMIELLKKYED